MTDDSLTLDEMRKMADQIGMTRLEDQHVQQLLRATISARARRAALPIDTLVAADELASLMETAHLLRSPANARRLLSALRRALARTGRAQTPSSLRRALELGASD